jgi:hypothetical protein
MKWRARCAASFCSISTVIFKSHFSLLVYSVPLSNADIQSTWYRGLMQIWQASQSARCKTHLWKSAHLDRPLTMLSIIFTWPWSTDDLLYPSVHPGSFTQDPRTKFYLGSEHIDESNDPIEARTSRNDCNDYLNSQYSSRRMPRNY